MKFGGGWGGDKTHAALETSEDMYDFPISILVEVSLNGKDSKDKVYILYLSRYHVCHNTLVHVECFVPSLPFK